MSNLNWNQVKADFHDANQSMATSSGAISQAGTIFGQLRKSILDEEQRAVDNAFREQKFNEDVRQFGLNYALNKDKFAEDVRHNKAGEQYNQDSLEETRLHHRKMEGLDAERLSLSRAQDARERWKLEQEIERNSRMDTAMELASGRAYAKEKAAWDAKLEETTGIGQAQKAYDENKQWLDNYNKTVEAWQNGTNTEYLPLEQRQAFHQEAFDRIKNSHILQANLAEAKKRADAWTAQNPAPIDRTPKDDMSRAMILMQASRDPKLALEYFSQLQSSRAKAAEGMANRQARITAAIIAAGGKGGSGGGTGSTNDKGNTPEDRVKGYTAYGVPHNDATGLAMVQGEMSSILANSGKTRLDNDTLRGILFDALGITKSVMSGTPWSDISYSSSILSSRKYDEVAKALRNPNDKSIPKDVRLTAENIRKQLLEKVALKESQFKTGYNATYTD